MQQNIICINSDVYHTPLDHFVSTGVYRAIPVITYKINRDSVKAYFFNKPLEVFKEAVSLSDMRKLFEGRENKQVFMQIPGESYKKMLYYINKNIDKVVADTLAYIIIKCIHELKGQGKNIFFISNPKSEKIIGRLGYLYPCNKTNTIGIISYNPTELLTNKASINTNRLEFDINYFKRKGSSTISDIIPNDSMESLIQTIFYKVPSADKELIPLRIDIFSQGISDIEIKKKVDDICLILEDTNNLSKPVKLEGNSYSRIPIGLLECIEASESYYRKKAEDILNEVKI